MAAPQKSTATTDDVEDQIKAIRADISKLTEIIGDLAGTKWDETKTAAKGEAQHLLNRSREMADSAQGKASHASESVENYIKEKPVQSAMIALVVGVLFGALSRR